MQNRNSKQKLNGKIIMMQNDLMSKLATIQVPYLSSTDELGFQQRGQQFNQLTNLLSKAKNVTTNNQQKITAARKSSVNLKPTKPIKRQSNRKSQDAGTFLTGVGISSEPQQQYVKSQQAIDPAIKQLQRKFYSNPIALDQQANPDEMIKQMIKKNKSDDLEELRRLIKQTDNSLQSYGKQLHKIRKDVLGVADKFNDIEFIGMKIGIIEKKACISWQKDYSQLIGLLSKKKRIIKQ